MVVCIMTELYLTKTEKTLTATYDEKTTKTKQNKKLEHTVSQKIYLY